MPSNYGQVGQKTGPSTSQTSQHSSETEYRQTGGTGSLVDLQLLPSQSCQAFRLEKYLIYQQSSGHTKTEVIARTSAMESLQGKI